MAGPILKGPDGRPIDPALAARLQKNPNLLLGRQRAASMSGQKPKMEIEIAVSKESVKAVEGIINGLRDEAKSLKELIDTLIERAGKLHEELKELRGCHIQ